MRNRLALSVFGDAVPLSAYFKAVLSTSSTIAITRLSSPAASVEVKTITGLTVAMGSSDLWDGNINNAVELKKARCLSTIR